MKMEMRTHYVWTEQLSPFATYTFSVHVSLRAPTADRFKRFPMWLWRHSYFTICDNAEEARHAFTRRVNNLRKLNFTVLVETEDI